MTVSIDRFVQVLSDEIEKSAGSPADLQFTVAEIYQRLIPYRTHRDRLGVEMNGDYEDALLRLLAGEGEFLLLESEAARNRIRQELAQSNPNTGIYREFAAVGVRLNPGRVPARTVFPAAEEPDTRPIQTSLEALGIEEPTPSRRQGASGPSGGKTADSTDTRGEVPLTGKGEGTRMAGGAPAPDSVAPSRHQGSGGNACPDCGGELPDRDSLRFCPHCGTNVLLAPCTSCGEVLERSWKFCLSCGTPAR